MILKGFQKSRFATVILVYYVTLAAPVFIGIVCKTPVKQRSAFMATVSFRCTDAQKGELELRSGGNTSAYIVSQLFDAGASNDALLHRLDDMRDDLIDAIASRAGDASPIRPRLIESLLIELVMTMRQSANKTAVKTAHAELDRLNLSVFESDAYRADEGDTP